MSLLFNNFDLRKLYGTFVTYHRMYKTIKSYLKTSIILYANYVMVIKPDRPISDVTDRL